MEWISVTSQEVEYINLDFCIQIIFQNINRKYNIYSIKQGKCQESMILNLLKTIFLNSMAHDTEEDSYFLRRISHIWFNNAFTEHVPSKSSEFISICKTYINIDSSYIKDKSNF